MNCSEKFTDVHLYKYCPLGLTYPKLVIHKCIHLYKYSPLGLAHLKLVIHKCKIGLPTKRSGHAHALFSSDISDRPFRPIRAPFVENGLVLYIHEMTQCFQAGGHAHAW